MVSLVLVANVRRADIGIPVAMVFVLQRVLCIRPIIETPDHMDAVGEGGPDAKGHPLVLGNGPHAGMSLCPRLAQRGDRGKS